MSKVVDNVGQQYTLFDNLQAVPPPAEVQKTKNSLDDRIKSCGECIKNRNAEKCRQEQENPVAGLLLNLQAILEELSNIEANAANPNHDLSVKDELTNLYKIFGGQPTFSEILLNAEDLVGQGKYWQITQTLGQIKTYLEMLNISETTLPKRTYAKPSKSMVCAKGSTGQDLASLNNR